MSEASVGASVEFGARVSTSSCPQLPGRGGLPRRAHRREDPTHPSTLQLHTYVLRGTPSILGHQRSREAKRVHSQGSTRPSARPPRAAAWSRPTDIVQIWQKHGLHPRLRQPRHKPTIKRRLVATRLSTRLLRPNLARAGQHDGYLRQPHPFTDYQQQCEPGMELLRHADAALQSESAHLRSHCHHRQRSHRRRSSWRCLRVDDYRRKPHAQI